MYTYEITDDFIVRVYAPDGTLVDWPGPWQDRDGAEQWAEMYVNALNNGEVPDPRVSND